MAETRNYNLRLYSTVNDRLKLPKMLNDSITEIDGAISLCEQRGQDRVISVKQNVGNLGDLTTIERTNLVSAINEVNAKANHNKEYIGTLNDLTTITKANLVSAINEINAKPTGGEDARLGDLNNLNTQDKTNIVASINEIYGVLNSIKTFIEKEHNAKDLDDYNKGDIVL